MSSLVHLEAADRPFAAYLAVPDRPRADIVGAVVVIHEVWGLVPHITRVTDRLAAAGFVAIAPDLLGPLALSPAAAEALQEALFSSDPAEREAAQLSTRDATAGVAAPEFAASALTKLVGTIDYLERISNEGDAQVGIDPSGENDPLPIGVVGFSFGGSYAFSLAIADARVRASVSYYGHVDFPTSLLADIGCPVLYFAGEDDEAVMDALPTLTGRLHESGTSFTPVTYPGTGHAFFNESNPAAYEPAAAEDSWARTVRFLTESLAH